MKKALSCEGLGRVASLEELVLLAAENRFECIDVAPALLRDAVGRLGMEGVKALLERNHVSIGSFPSSCPWADDRAQFEEGLTILENDAALFAALGCGICHTFIMPSCDESVPQWAAVAIERIRRISDLIGGHGIRLALEYVGPHSMRRLRNHPFVWNIEGALNLIRLVDRPNVGLLVDSFHWFTAQETEDDIRGMPKGLIFHVHVNDAPNLPVDQLYDDNRLYPGEGIINLSSFMRALRDAEYSGIVALEVLRPTPVAQDNALLARKAAGAFEKLFRY